jgi:hypothetical protein
MPSVVRKLCSLVQNVSLSSGDTLFASGAMCSHMYFVLRGALSYMPQQPGSTTVQLHYGNWCCEASLWTPWHHRGKMRAKQDCRLISMSSAKFREVLTTEFQDATLPKMYAGAFVKALNDILNQEGPTGANISDVQDDAFVHEVLKIAIANRTCGNLRLLCPAGCGFEVTFHETHCCGQCRDGIGHGPRCDRKPCSS